MANSTGLSLHVKEPQGFVLSPTLFNLYLKDINKCLHSDTSILQYTDDIVIYASAANTMQSVDVINITLANIYSYLRNRGLELSPTKSTAIVFYHSRFAPKLNSDIRINSTPLPIGKAVRFLGIVLDCKLRGDKHFDYLINKGRKIVNIISSLSGVWWGAHPHLLLTLYRSLFRSSIEYGSHIFVFKHTKTLFLKLQRLQFKAIRKALGYRMSTPINVILSEAKEPPLHLRFAYLASKYLYKQHSIDPNPVLESFKLILSKAGSGNNRMYLLQTFPLFKIYYSSNSIRLYALLPHSY